MIAELRAAMHAAIAAHGEVMIGAIGEVISELRHDWERDLQTVREQTERIARSVSPDTPS